MITTNDAYSAPNFFQSVESPTYNWRCVDFSLSIPYFFVEYSYKEDGARLNSRKLVSSVSDFIQICSNIRLERAAKLKQAAMLAPPWVSLNKNWEMIDLVAINLVEFDKFPFYVFVASDGRQLTEASNSIDLAKVKKINTVFRRNKK